MAAISFLGLPCGAPGAASSPSIVTPGSSASATARPDSGVSSGAWLDLTPRMRVSPRLPAAAEDCAAIVDPVRHRMVMFGGKDDSNQNRGEIWALDLDGLGWNRIDVAGVAPPASEDHTLIFDPVGYRMILHGGENGLTSNKTWSFDLRANRWRDMTDSTGPAREDHTAIYDSRGKRMVVFGGRDNTGTIDYVNISELMALDLDPQSPTFERWSRLPAGKDGAPGRSDHAAIYDARKNRMVVFGGWDKARKEYLDDTWAFSFAVPPETVGTWKKIKAKLSHPPKRRHVTGVLDEGRNWFVICGGRGDEGFLNDVWALDLDRDVWIDITPGPQPRLDHLAIYDPKSRAMILYGGDAHWSTKFHDLWELQVRPEVSADSLR